MFTSWIGHRSCSLLVAIAASCAVVTAEEQDPSDADRSVVWAEGAPAPSSDRAPPDRRSANTSPTPSSSRSPESESSLRRAGTPNMFGDNFSGVGGTVSVANGLGYASASLPLAGGGRRLKAAENNQALPEDRVFAQYNHFANALAADASQISFGSSPQQFAVDRYLLGFEKTFFDGLCSVELLMPVSSRMDFATSHFGVSGGDAGNLSVLCKGLLYQTDYSALAVGLQVDTPTGSDVQGYIDDFPGRSRFTVYNQAFHVMPFVAFLATPSDRLFCHGVLQVDIPTNGNRIEYQSPSSDPATIGMLTDQTLLNVDFSAGCWLFRNRPDRVWTGLAAVLELHYTGMLQAPDTVLFEQNFEESSESAEFKSAPNSMNILNLTVGLQATLGTASVCRVGGVFPLRTGDNRTFDSEFVVQLERRF